LPLLIADLILSWITDDIYNKRIDEFNAFVICLEKIVKIQ